METMTVASLTGLDVTDHCTEALHEVIEAKAEHRAPKPAEGEEEPTAPVVDLMAALEKSVADAREHRGKTADGGEATVHEMPAKPKKKKKKKTAAKKAPPGRPRQRRRPAARLPDPFGSCPWDAARG
ncbi:hypothetical protein [Streptomyces sp. NBC_00233]|uniref:hypothetical protein n=1 Tax=Streptomyces sp. NBC_00233 TaxID=2975686 RepID=UPI00224E35D9|nr:hypothetical protein [Streptomyces sp. NBC_00233]MCX5232985.1 hypothetical protein [Streptomyces sp. NBC_00233]